MSIPPAWPQVLDFFGSLPVIEPSPGQLSGDAGLLPIRQFDEQIGLTQTLAAVATAAWVCRPGTRSANGCACWPTAFRRRV
jgi:hypothetical protein